MEDNRVRKIGYKFLYHLLNLHHSSTYDNMKKEKPKKRLTRKEVLETIRKEDSCNKDLKDVVKGRKYWMEKDNGRNLSLENLYPFRSSTFFKKTQGEK